MHLTNNFEQSPVFDIFGKSIINKDNSNDSSICCIYIDTEKSKMYLSNNIVLCKKNKINF